MVTKEDCEREGKIFVPSHTTKEGSYIHAYCKERNEDAPSYRDRNGNRRLKWKRHSDSRETEYIAISGSKEGVVKSFDGRSVWWVDENGRREKGESKNVREAKSEVERRLRF